MSVADNVSVVLFEKLIKRNRSTHELFSMNFWEDEKSSRKFIKENLMLIAQNAKDNGVKTHFNKQNTPDGMQVAELQYADEVSVVKKDGTIEKRLDFSGRNYLRVTLDPNRKISGGPQKQELNEDGTKKTSKKVLKKFKNEV